MSRNIRILIGAALLAVATASVGMQAYVTNGLKWPTNVVTFYANPNTVHTSVSSAEEALKAALAGWGAQSNANFQFVYGGRVNDTTITNDHRNVTIFRNATSGGAIASTYWWSNNGSFVDADVIFWDGYMPFYGAYDTCSGVGAYIQDVAIHEYGHALGLSHSGDPDATMYGAYYACTSGHRTLSADDIAGVEHLYPSTGGRTTNTAPSVSIYSPGNSTTVITGTPISFSGAASDSQDGNLSGGMAWSSSLSGYLGTGASFGALLPIGTHTITAAVTDSGGMSASAQITVTVAGEAAAPAPAPSGPTLAVRSYKVKGTRRADLSWSNLSATTVTIFRNGSIVYSGANNSAYLDVVGGKGAGTFSYQVCDAAGGQCTNSATARF